MVDYSNPFLTSFRGSRNQFTQPQNQQNQYDFSGWGDRLNKIEEGIAGLTDQFNNFQNPGDVAPEYTGNAAPEPLGQTANAPEPLGGIESLAPTQNTGFNFDPQGITTDQWGNEQTGNLQAQLAQAYGGQTHNEQMGRGPAGFTQGFADFFTGEGYYADPRGTYLDGSWNISDKPIDLGSRFGGTLDPYGNQGSVYPVVDPNALQIQYGNQQQDKTWSPPAPGWRPDQGTPPPQQSLNSGLAGLKPGLTGLAAYQQNNKGAGI